MSIYNPTVWVNDSPPPINASNLNKLEEGVVNAHVEIASQGVALASSVAYASTLFSNIGALSSQVAAHSTSIYDQGNAIATVTSYASTLYGLISAQNAAIASNTQGVASLLPVVATHTVQIADLYGQVASAGGDLTAVLATQAAHATSLSELVPTTAAHATLLAEIIATQTEVINVNNFQASELADHATQIAGIANSALGFTHNFSTLNRSGNGPVDLWDQVAPVGVTATSALARAIAMRYDPVATIGGAPATGISNLSGWLLPNAGVASPTRQFALGLIDGTTGTVMAWTGVQSVPSVATGLDVQLASYLLQLVQTSLPSPYHMNPDQPYFLMVAADDTFRLNMLGKPYIGDAAKQARFQRNLAFEYALPSGLFLASYGSFRIPGSLPYIGATSITTAVPTPVAPGDYPAVFVE